MIWHEPPEHDRRSIGVLLPVVLGVLGVVGWLDLAGQGDSTGCSNPAMRDRDGLPSFGAAVHCAGLTQVAVLFVAVSGAAAAGALALAALGRRPVWAVPLAALALVPAVLLLAAYR